MPEVEQAPDAPQEIEDAHRLVTGAGPLGVVVLTGAGISTDSGIPDFRGPQGLWTKDPSAERLATLDVYLSEPKVRERAWRTRVESGYFSAAPNGGHRALVDLERQGLLDTLVTQNVDGLHHDAGNDPARIIEIHGTVREVMCMSCGERNPMASVLARVEAGETDPPCRARRGEGQCGGILKSATISFGQNLVAKDLVAAEEAAGRCAVMLAVGSSLGVYPAAGLVPLAVSQGAALIIVNAQETPFDDLAEVVLRGPISEVLPQVVGAA
jgi:NAD-dependent deacetylase